MSDGGYGTGSVKPYDTAGGERWSATFWYADRTGKRRQRKLSGYLKEAQARKALRDALYERDHGQQRDKSTMTVKSYAETKYLPWCADRVTQGRIKAITLRNYRGWLTRDVYPHIGHVRVQDLTRDHVQVMIDALAGRSPNSVNSVVTLLGAVLDLAIDDDLLLVNPAKSKRLSKPTKASDPEAPWTVDESRAYLRTLDTDGDPLELAFYLMALTGIRRAEAAGLRWGDFDAAKGVLRINRSVSHVDGVAHVSDGGKSRQARRLVGLRPRMGELLAAHRAREAARFWSSGRQFSDESPMFATWFCEPFAPSTFTARFSVTVKRAGLRHIKLHTLRHGYVTQAQHVEGVSAEMVAKVVGHKTVSMTAHYSHPDEVTAHAVSDAVASRLLGEVG